MKIAAMEGMWNTEPAPAALNLIGFPDQAQHITRDTIQIPYLLGIIATRSFTLPVLGIDDLVIQNQARITEGIKAYNALQLLIKNPNDKQAESVLNAHVDTLGYALLLKKYTNNIASATPEEIHKAAWDTVPNVTPIFWSFRVMVACGIFFILLFIIAFVLSIQQKWENRWFLRIALLSLPLPWIAAEFGWIVAEHGRQPWVIEGVLPTFLGTSSLATKYLYTSLIGFILLYGFMTIVELYLMFKYVRLGPEHYLSHEEKT